MVLISLKDITNCNDYYIDDETLQIYSFKYKKYTEGKLLKPSINRDGYIFYRFCMNGKVKNILYHHIIVKMFINPNFDSTKEEIDHKDCNKLNNNIENLAVVTHLENCRNQSSMNGEKFNFVDNIGKSLVINSEAGIYYSLETDHFYMLINQTNKYKELHIYLNNGKNPYIVYNYNNKQHKFSVNKFRKNLNKQ